MKLSSLERIVMGVAAALVFGTAVVLCLGNRPVSVVVVTESERPSGRVVASEGKKLPGDAGGLFQLPEETTSAAETGAQFSRAPEESEPLISSPAESEGVPAEEKMNLNTVTEKELDQLPGIGEKRAAAIVAYREEHGPFTRIEQIMRVPGIGSGIFNQIKPYITVE